MTMGRTAPMQLLTERPEWKALAQHRQHMGDRHLRQICAGDPRRGERLTAEAEGLYLDHSKHRVTDETLGLLRRLADDCGLAERIDAMFRGRKINVTEQRAALHVALRVPAGERILADGVDVVPAVHAVLDRMAAFSEEIQTACSHIDSPDQWGVELGKALAQRIVGEPQGSGALSDAHDSSTTALIRRYLGARGRAG